ncbi:hypothetical protein DVH24_035245 [Malus domestica]|uniref:ADP-ribosyl cyclase/cyclic ADP-ribose hydrolase n=1 Tax=Malus domestica TaxID=3750 RepID=A0A498JAU0_MALDO|nr:hypothetical protein DVH24_035245 [Malus domestica]
MDTSSTARGTAIAASSSSSCRSNPWKGDDTRTTFTDHLSIAVHNAGIHTLIDYQLRRGENIEGELDQEIKGPSSVFSKRYMESGWCLRELAKIMRCQEDQEGKVVYPILYDVDPLRK